MYLFFLYSEATSAVCGQEHVLRWAMDGEAGAKLCQMAQLCTHTTRDVYRRQKTERFVCVSALFAISSQSFWLFPTVLKPVLGTFVI